MEKQGWIVVYIIAQLLWYRPLFCQIQLEDSWEILDNLPEQSIEQLQDEIGVLEHFQFLATHPMDLNAANASDLERLHILNLDEIKAIIKYRNSFGPLIDPLELQVIEALSMEKIQQILPFVMVNALNSYQQGSKGYFLLRTSGYYPWRVGFLNQNNKPTPYQGDPTKVLFKYREYNSRRYSWGVSMEKDAGEKFSFSGQPGFDHIHFHYYKTGRKGGVKTIALGDYRINMGQGLLQYQGFAITKSSNPLLIKRVATVIQPYSGTSEYYYYRGIAIELASNSIFRNFAFFHYKNRDATLRTKEDGSSYFSAFRTSGLHRTGNEVKNRNVVGETIGGHRIQWSNNGWSLGLNSIFQRFSLPFQPLVRIDNFHRLTGKDFMSHSLDFNGHLGSFHLFGEIATQNYHSPAITATGLYSFHPKFDGGLLIRRFPAYYAPLFANPFSARSSPNNESGIYLGLNYHIGPYSRISFYLDSWKALWPAFQAHGPSFDQDIFLRYELSRRRKWEAYAQIKYRLRADNHKTNYPVYNTVTYRNQLKLRLQFRKIDYKHWRWTNRVEAVRISSVDSHVEYGIMGFTDLLWNPIDSWWSIASRIAYFKTASFATRIYAYEPDIRYSFSIPFFYGRGWRLAFRISRKWRNGIRVELRSGWTWLPDEKQVGSGYNAVPGSYSQQSKLQIMYEF